MLLVQRFREMIKSIEISVHCTYDSNFGNAALVVPGLAAARRRGM
jgi:hypothetical protein